MMRRACLAALAALWLALGIAAPAQAGRQCTENRPTTAALARDMALAASVAEQLDAMAAQGGLRVGLLARAGQDLTKYGLRFSHLGIVYRDDAALGGRGAWRVMHKLNHCGSDRAAVYRQGLAEFFSEGLFTHEAGLVVLRAPLARDGVLAALKDNAAMTRLHEPRYNMLAYPWAGPYQQSNQWALETLAMLADADVVTRAGARSWLRLRGYQPTTLHIPAPERLGARITMGHVAFDDHPFGRRMAGQIDTVTVDSVFAFVQRNGLGEPVRVLRTQPAGAMTIAPSTATSPAPAMPSTAPAAPAAPAPILPRATERT